MNDDNHMVKVVIKNMAIQDYIVCYFDFLGQRSGLLKAVRESPNMPNVQLEVDKISAAIQRFNTAIMGTKRMIMEEPEKLLQAIEFPKEFPEEVKQVFPEKIKNLHFDIQQFSDSTLFFANIEKADCVGMGIFITWCLSLAANFIQLLSEHFMIRGGIAIGKGWKIEPDLLYGPVLEDVYMLESKIAVFPRIVITEEVLRRLEAVDRKCTEFFCEDYDGVHILDYLSLSAIRWYETNMAVQGANLIHSIKEALHFIRTEYDLLKGGVSRNIDCAKEVRKLSYLIGYWQSRLDAIIKMYQSNNDVPNADGAKTWKSSYMTYEDGESKVIRTDTQVG